MALTSDRWKRTKELFEAATPLPEEKRTAWLSEHCDDREMRAEVELLLQHHEAVGEFIDEPAVVSPVESPIDVDLGPYRVIRPIGEGGMGTVYLAERSDAEFDRQVAVKVVRGALSSALSDERFRRERQILADLEHPAISRLIDGGTTRSGRPYLVMELIEGMPIDRFCSEHRSSLDERLDLFTQVTDAVSYAHRNLVVHRDIKPSNVLVTHDGQPKLLDFGTAKLLDPDRDAIGDLTLNELRAFTPAYASPEQLRGGTITTATDVYALGVLLYLLVSGRHPFPDLDPISPESIRAVCEDDPPAPSVAVKNAPPERRFHENAASASRSLSGDLDTIIAKAMRKESAERYASVADFAADLRRYRAGLPVGARRGNLAYHTTKLVKRHRAVAAATMIAIVAGAVGLGTTLWQARRAIRESDRAEMHLAEALEREQQAELQRNRAQQVSNYLVDLFETTDPNRTPGHSATAEEVLESGVRRIDDLDDQPELQAELLGTMASAFARLQLHDRARDLFERALSIRDDAAQSDERALVGNLSNLANSLLALDEIESAEGHLERAERLARDRYGNGDAELGDVLDDLAWIRLEQGRVDEASALAEETLAIRRRAFEPPHEAIAESLSFLASVRMAQRSPDEAETTARSALQAYRELFGADHTEVVMASNNLAQILAARGEVTEAEGLLRSAIETDRRLLPRAHLERASLVDNLGAVLQMRGETTKSLELHREALQMRRELLGNEHVEVASSLYNLASLRARQGANDDATEHYQEAHRIWESALGSEHPSSMRGLRGLAWHRYRIGQYRAAEPVLRQLLELQKSTGASPSDRAPNLRFLGVSLTELGRATEAESTLRAAIAAEQTNDGTELWRVARAESALGGCLTRLGRFEEAEKLLLRAHQRLQDELGPDHKSTRRAAERLLALETRRTG